MTNDAMKKSTTIPKEETGASLIHRDRQEPV